MARIRTIKPEFWTDWKTGTLSPIATKTFIGLLNYADDYGVMPFNLSEIGARQFPYDPPESRRVFLPAVFTDELLPKGLCVLFSFENSTYLWISGFSEHQKVDKRGKALIDGWTETSTPFDFTENIEVVDYAHETEIFDESPRIPPNPAEDSLWKGKERKGKDSRGGDRECEGKGPSLNSDGSSAVASRTAKPAEPDKPPVFTFPCSGKPKTWDLTQSHLQRLIELYPTLDVKAECRKALAYAEAGNAKTARGMPRFLANWLNRATDRKPTHHLTNGRETRGDRNKRLAEQWILDHERTEGTT